MNTPVPFGFRPGNARTGHHPLSMARVCLWDHWHDPGHFELLDYAEGLAKRGVMDRNGAMFAVIAAQTACEVYAEVAIGELLARRALPPQLEESMLDRLNFSMRDRRELETLGRASPGSESQNQDFWNNSRAH